MARGHGPRLGEASARGRVSLLAIGLALAGSAAIPATAEAFELFGWRPFGGPEPVDAFESPDARPYTIEVSVPGDDAGLTDVVQGASRLFRERDEAPPPSTAALLNRVDAEYARITGALYTQGRYGGAITITVDGRDPSTIERDAVLPNPVPIRIAVDPGPLFRFGSVRIEGRAPTPANEDDLIEATPDTRGLVPGGVARSQAVIATERLLVDEWREQGYPKARIAERDAVADHPTSRLDVSIMTESGPPATFGPVTVSGTEAMDPDFVVWMTGIKPGTSYDPDDIRRAERNLRRLQVFAATRFTEAEAVGPDGQLPLALSVAERPRRALGAGATYSTVDGAGIEGYWEHRNLFGRAERLRLEARVDGINSVDPADFNYLIGASFLKPGVFTPFTDLEAQLTAEQNDLDTYNQQTVRARVGISHEVFEGLRLSSALNLEASNIDGVYGDRDFLLVSLPSVVDYDGRNDPLEPTRGVRARLGLEPFYEFEFGNGGLIADLKGSTYWSFDPEGKWVLAARGGVGSIVGAPADEIPENKLFYVGGGGSVRGYSYRSIGPVVNDEVVGGRSYVEASLELRARVTDTIGIVPFVDAGAAFESSFPDFSDSIKVGAGIGVRYYTSLGPIRADVAIPLDPGPDDPSFAVYIGLGQAF